jgi:hypothetical protein
VGAIVAGRNLGDGDPPASSIRLLVDVGDGTAAGDAITVQHGDAVVATGRAAAGGAAVAIDAPWTDLIVEATLNGARQQIGVLPVQPGAEVAVSFTTGRRALSVGLESPVHGDGALARDLPRTRDQHRGALVYHAR